MRCRACNRILETFELTKKDTRGEFIDLCRYCLTPSVTYAGMEIEEEFDNLYGLLTNDEDYDTLF